MKQLKKELNLNPEQGFWESLGWNENEKEYLYNLK